MSFCLPHGFFSRKSTRTIGLWCSIATLLLLLAPQTYALNDVEFERPNEPLNVAVRVGAPFVIERADGSLDGISVALWEEVASQLNVAFDYQVVELDALLQGMYNQDFDVGIGPLTVTAERERMLDFTQPFHSAGLGIAVRQEDRAGWWAVAQRFVTKEFASVMLALSAVLLLSGFSLWLFERKHNPDEFSQDKVKGIGAGFWWAAVTMTTVGYGDKSPRSTGGRVVALIWMFTSVIIISSFTASIASSLTVNELASRIEGPSDLDRVRVATIPNSFTSEYLDQRFISYRPYANIEAALDALAAQEVDAVVHDAPLLNYQLRQRFDADLMLLPNTFNAQNYAFTLVEGSDMLEATNRTLLDVRASPNWNNLLERYMGE
ncbi:transporter substrate-binding domain-containing protein [Aliidiomarina maris]|uniref:ABC transporter substrate-binding protein n=1 Tax=Aliidiomarina maris TaxID=531312 RepID=A0A327X273_9GAMM|nr:transporter substrate-binding domain-containing protein [Aliidiomarina maris]RAJ98404.1 amino acid ABC transporter substrate-binding protein (PAAT family) [Aliidiomarina maris]RUO24781.1 ABC transporter substrate-binding protein [Aliidiomarina maris]